MLETLSPFISVIAFIVILGVLVFVHELGHFLAAKLSGVGVEEFAFGFGKSIFQKEFRGTVYKINWLPFGGFVKLQGENSAKSDTNSLDIDPHSYANKPLHLKLFILFAGVTMNVILAIFLFAAFLAISNYRVEFRAVANMDFVGVENSRLMIAAMDVNQDSPAQGLLDFGDVITGINGQRFTKTEDFKQILDQNAGQTVTLQVLKLNDLNSPARDVTLKLREKQEGRPVLGVGYASFFVLDYPNNVLSAIPHTWNMFKYQIISIGNLISTSIDQGNADIALREVGGVIAVGNLVGQVVSLGEFVALINLAALLSITLAFFNVLPFPLLDGGQAVIETLQTITGNRIPAKLINVINNVGFVMLILLSVLITFKDAIQFDVLGSIFSAIRTVLGR